MEFSSFFERLSHVPRKTDHRKARGELAKLAPETLQAVTVRLPAGLLIGVHRWAEEKGLDLASAIRDLTALGREAAARPEGQGSAAARKAAKRWRRPVERALWAGLSPVQPLLGEEISEADLEALPLILAELDYRGVFQGLKGKQERDSAEERVWKGKKADASAHVRPLMEALDHLDSGFLARKKLSYREGPEGEFPLIHWLLSEAVMQQLAEASSGGSDVEAVRQLISARYLVAIFPNRPWEFEWDD
jgi:hypothetical protein